MFVSNHRDVAWAIALVSPLSIALPAFAQDAAVAPAGAASAASATLPVQQVIVNAVRQKLDTARNGRIWG